MLSALEISASGLESRRLWMNTIAENIANAETTRNAFGDIDPYRRRAPVFAELQVGGSTGVTVLDIVSDPSPLRVVHDPGHPDADAEGNVHYPNVNIVREMVDMMMASRSYEANVTAMETTKSMFASALRIIA